MGWKKDWKFLNFQVPPVLNDRLLAIYHKTGRSRPDQVREALMTHFGIEDLSLEHAQESGQKQSFGKCKSGVA